VRTSHAGSLRFPELRQSSQGESGPKPRLRSVGDGHAVHIRQPPTFVLRLTISIHGERSALGLRSRERFVSESRRSEGAIYGSRPNDDDESGEKIRGHGYRS
jgi:hypothetical protein